MTTTYIVALSMYALVVYPEYSSCVPESFTQLILTLLELSKVTSGTTSLNDPSEVRSRVAEPVMGHEDALLAPFFSKTTDVPAAYVPPQLTCRSITGAFVVPAVKCALFVIVCFVAFTAKLVNLLHNVDVNKPAELTDAAGIIIEAVFHGVPVT